MSSLAKDSLLFLTEKQHVVMTSRVGKSLPWDPVRFEMMDTISDFEISSLGNEFHKFN